MALFAQDISRDSRIAAIELKRRAEAFLAGPGHPAGSEAARLASAISSAPAWLLSKASLGLLNPISVEGCPEFLSRSAKAVMPDLVAYIASGIGLRTFLAMEATNVPNAQALSESIQQAVEEMESRLRAKSPRDRAYSRRFLREQGAYELGTSSIGDAISKTRGERPQALPGICKDLDVACEGGLSLRPLKDRELAGLARQMEDGWDRVSPSLHAQGRRSQSERHSWLFRLAREDRQLGIFDGKELVGSLVVTPVSATQAEIGWFVAGDRRRQGIASRALAGLMPALDALGIEEVGAMCFDDNVASIRLMEGLGFAARPDEVALEPPLNWVGFTARPADFTARPALP